MSKISKLEAKELHRIIAIARSCGFFEVQRETMMRWIRNGVGALDASERARRIYCRDNGIDPNETADDRVEQMALDNLDQLQVSPPFDESNPSGIIRH
jgi:hypothetical protein